MSRITTASEFDTVLNSSKVVIVDFTAAWCGPCKMISPIFHQLAEEYKDIPTSFLSFIVVDVDQVSEIARRYQISSMPTFKAFVVGTERDSFSGASPPQLKDLVETHVAVARKYAMAGQKIDKSEEELMGLSVKELKRLLAERSISSVGAAEKRDLVMLLRDPPQ